MYLEDEDEVCDGLRTGKLARPRPPLARNVLDGFDGIVLRDLVLPPPQHAAHRQESHLGYLPHQGGVGGLGGLLALGRDVEQQLAKGGNGPPLDSLLRGRWAERGRQTLGKGAQVQTDMASMARPFCGIRRDNGGCATN
jgi:hypothetical protein